MQYINSRLSRRIILLTKFLLNQQDLKTFIYLLILFFQELLVGGYGFFYFLIFQENTIP